ncbi:unnamed protein product [Sphagnum troendelagicum]|uniref:HMA domain-containing protein n=1 Tax=Sphagnum troendelagicum TaxID=128251 RepID=A0ABP0TT37_9BRYO
MSIGMNELFYRQGEEPAWIVDRNGSYRDNREVSPFSRHGRYLQDIDLKVPMCCAKCEEKVREELLDVEGVYSVVCDQHCQKVTVTGNYNSVDPLHLLKKVKRIKKNSKFWAENTRIDDTQYYGSNSRSYNTRHRNEYTSLPLSTRTFFDPYYNDSARRFHSSASVASGRSYSNHQDSRPYGRVDRFMTRVIPQSQTFFPVPHTAQSLDYTLPAYEQTSYYNEDYPSFRCYY